MPLIAKEKSGSDIDPIPEGVYIGRCYGVVDLGTHLNPVFNTEQRKVLIQWEIPEVRCDVERDGKRVDLPRAISRRYTLSLSDKANLRRDIEAWRGRKFTPQELAGFDLKSVLGAACQIQVAHETNKEGRTYASIAAIMALPRGVQPPAGENAVQYFSFDDGEGPVVMPDNLPEWVRKIIMESVEWKRGCNTFAEATAASVPGQVYDPIKPSQHAPAQAPAPAPAVNWREHKIHFGKHTGTRLGDLPDPSLRWFCEKWEPSDWPTGSGKYKPEDLALRKALDAAMTEQAKTVAEHLKIMRAQVADARAADNKVEEPPVDDRPPVVNDDDVPF